MNNPLERTMRLVAQAAALAVTEHAAQIVAAPQVAGCGMLQAWKVREVMERLGDAVRASS